jgi:hypothetical protein
MARTTDWQIKLTGLIAFGKIGVKVIFSIPFGKSCNLRVQSATGPDRKVNRRLIQHRKRTWQAKANGANLCVGWTAKGRAATTEQFRIGLQLDMHFEANYRAVSYCHFGKL